MAVSFAQDIRPLFTDIDVAHMRNLGVSLDDFDYMRDPSHAQRVLGQVSAGVMPPRRSGEPAWSPETVQLFRDWIADGYQPQLKLTRSYQKTSCQTDTAALVRDGGVVAAVQADDRVKGGGCRDHAGL